MRVHLLSDLHLEFAPFAVRVRDADVTVLAGDIHTKGRSVAWALATFPGRVLVVPGNHEYYGGHMQRTLAKMRGMANERVMVLDRDEVVIDGVRFLGATAWTDQRSTGNFSEALRAAGSRMNDYVTIRCARGGRDFARLTPAVTAARAEATRLWLEAALVRPHPGPTVVITHHAPSLLSLSGGLANEPLAASYANSWDHLFDPTVSLWLHGHTHQAADYVVNGTRVVCNSRGYPGEEENGFRPSLVLEVS